MATYKGKNDLKSLKRLARERVIYNSEVKNVTDFNFAEKTLYGRVDRQHNPIIPRMNYLKPVSLSNSKVSMPVMLMNFVSDQFTDFEQHFARGCQLGNIPNDDPIFSSIQHR